MVDMPNDTRMALGEILGSQKHLVKQLDGVVSGFQDFRKEMRDEQNAISDRITRLEQFQWKLIGTATVGGLFVPILTSLTVWYLTR